MASNLFGRARFASRAEARAAFGGDRGIVIGRTSWPRRYLVDSGPAHVLLAAPSRSGKDWGVVLPTLLNWHGSVVVTDPKGESWDHAAGWLAARGVECYRLDFEPASGRGHAWNPYARLGAGDPLSAIQSTNNLMVPEAPSTADPMWTENARALLDACALYLHETAVLCPGAMLELLEHPAGIREHLGAEAKRLVRRLTARTARKMGSLAAINEKTFESIRAHAVGKFRLFGVAAVDAATARSDFDAGQMRRQRMAVFVCVNPDSLAKFRPLVALFLQQALEANLSVLPEHDATLRVPLLFVLNEFTQFGAMPAIVDRVGLVAGYGIRYLVSIQSMSALERLYGEKAAAEFEENCATRIYFQPHRTEEAERISRALYARTVKATSRSRAPLGATKNLSESDTRRPLMLPAEVEAMGVKRCIIRSEACRHPVLAKKILGWRDRLILSSMLPAPEVPALAPRVIVPASARVPAPSAEHVARQALAALQDIE